MASPDIPSFRPQTAAPKPAVERGAGLFHAKELTYSKEQLLALRPRSGAAVGATYDGDGLPSGVYSIDPLAPASQPGPLPQLKSVAPLPRRDAAGRGRGRGDEPFGQGFGGAAPAVPYKAAGPLPPPGSSVQPPRTALGGALPPSQHSSGSQTGAPAWGANQVEFFYKDTLGDRHGPKSSVELLKWLRAGLFQSDIEVSLDGETGWVKLSDAVDVATGLCKLSLPAPAVADAGARQLPASSVDDDLASLSRNTGDLQRRFEDEKRALQQKGAAPQHHRLDGLPSQQTPQPDALPSPEALGLPHDTPPHIVAAALKLPPEEREKMLAGFRAAAPSGPHGTAHPNAGQAPPVGRGAGGKVAMPMGPPGGMGRGFGRGGPPPQPQQPQAASMASSPPMSAMVQGSFGENGLATGGWSGDAQFQDAPDVQGSFSPAMDGLMVQQQQQQRDAELRGLQEQRLHQMQMQQQQNEHHMRARMQQQLEHHAKMGASPQQLQQMQMQHQHILEAQRRQFQQMQREQHEQLQQQQEQSGWGGGERSGWSVDTNRAEEDRERDADAWRQQPWNTQGESKDNTMHQDEQRDRREQQQQQQANSAHMQAARLKAQAEEYAYARAAAEQAKEDQRRAAAEASLNTPAPWASSAPGAGQAPSLDQLMMQEEMEAQRQRAELEQRRQDMGQMGVGMGPGGPWGSGRGGELPPAVAMQQERELELQRQQQTMREQQMRQQQQAQAERQHHLQVMQQQQQLEQERQQRMRQQEFERQQQAEEAMAAKKLIKQGQQDAAAAAAAAANSEHAQVAQMRARADAQALEEVMRQQEVEARQAEEARRRALKEASLAQERAMQVCLDIQLRIHQERIREERERWTDDTLARWHACTHAHAHQNTCSWSYRPRLRPRMPLGRAQGV